MSETGEPLTSVSALQQIVEWADATPLTEWQRDALRRLCSSCPISREEEAAVFLQLKSHHSLLENGETSSEPIPVTLSDVPTNATSASSVTLLGIRNPKHVNALSCNQSLRFHENGITVIFGNNGSGKSGYTRILKSVCRARSAEDILHNVYDQKPAEPASATLTYKVGAVEQPHFHWTSGTTQHSCLSSVSVFDSKCALIHVDEKNEAAYIPQPLRILKELSDICRRFKSSLQSTTALLEANVPIGMRDLKCDKETQAGKFLHELSAESTFEYAERIAALTDKDMSRIDELLLALKSDPRKLAEQEEARNRRLFAVIQRVQSLASAVDDTAVAAFQNLLNAERIAVQAASVAASKAFEDETLEGIGSETWKSLWEAARKYSESEAYPDQCFPATDKALCLLCAQPIAEEAAKRLVGFEAFVKDHAQKAVDAARSEIDAARKTLRLASLSSEQVRQDISLLEEELDNQTLAHILRRFYRECAVRLGRMAQANSDEDWPAIRPITGVPNALIGDELRQRKAWVAELRASADEEQSNPLQRELKELQDRVFLKSILEDVKAEIERKRKLARVKLALAETDTNKITRKSTEFADSLVTDAWRDRFAAEISRMDIHHLRIELQREGGEYGAAKFRVALIRDSSVKLGRVLSEGEYRCIALAAFFSELATSDHRSSLVFDDPVSSLDHEHREAVAKRLAQEAATGRQVIVFTHDVYFLDLVSRHTKELGVPAKYLTVNRFPQGDNCGAVDDGVPSTVAPSLDLADGIRRQVKQFEGLYQNGRIVQWNSQTNSFSIRLRKCWERAVAEALSPVVERFNASVDTKNVWKIAALEISDCVTMRQAYKRCSELNHEKCAEQNRNDPTPNDYYQEIAVLEQWIKDVRKKQSDAWDNRPSV